MENTSYALHIAAGLMIAIMVIGLILYVYRAMSTEQKSEDDSWAIKTKAEFNEEFLAFDKPLMYGVDVLSCLNKALSNNQRYVYNNYYGTDEASAGGEDKQHFMDVQVTLKTTLKETIKVTAFSQNGNSVDILNTSFENNAFNGKYFSIPKVKYYYFQNGASKSGELHDGETSYKKLMFNGNIPLKTGTYNTKMSVGTYNLLRR